MNLLRVGIGVCAWVAAALCVAGDVLFEDIIGDLRNPEVQRRAGELRLRPDKVEQVAVYTLDGRLYLSGNQPRGVLYAVYSFLQRQLGVRWLWPGPDGEFVGGDDIRLRPAQMLENFLRHHDQAND
jgi:hypothetical protein